MTTSASQLLHTIVVIGASVGCGSEPTSQAPRNTADASVNPVDASAPDGTAAPDVASGPTSMCDCARPGTFRCSACTSGIGPIEGRCPNDDGAGCFCDTTIPIAAPSDCEHPEQFACSNPPPFDASTGLFFTLGWFAFADCSCNPARPVIASECTCERCVLSCQNGTCPVGSAGASVNSAVRYACACLPPPVPIAA